MSDILINVIRKSREIQVQVGKYTFTCLRPTSEQAHVLFSNSEDRVHIELCKRHVIGWSGLSEDDVCGNKNSSPVAFEGTLWAEWIADRPDLWTPIASKLIEALQAHTDKVQSNAKK